MRLWLLLRCRLRGGRQRGALSGRSCGGRGLLLLLLLLLRQHLRVRLLLLLLHQLLLLLLLLRWGLLLRLLQRRLRAGLCARLRLLRRLRVARVTVRVGAKLLAAGTVSGRGVLCTHTEQMHACDTAHRKKHASPHY